ncbi:unnamed protein product [Arctia plantaginis]|uniref:Uncharacterized protein n=1 Tax=Arctia plantaginis TaxID=874455 RepID=A0A8S0Z6R2_ARCPL|nr:unnamed protein product [Arctia plantaginis]
MRRSGLVSSELKTAQMVIVKQNKCCFCGELRTSTLICSYLTLARDVIVTVASITLFCLSGSAITFISGVGISVFCVVIAIVFTNVLFTIVLIIVQKWAHEGVSYLQCGSYDNNRFANSHPLSHI